MALLLCWFLPFLGTLGAGIIFAGTRHGPVKDGIAMQTEAAGENPDGSRQEREENEGAASAVAQPDPAGNGRPAGVSTAGSGEAGRPAPAAGNQWAAGKANPSPSTTQGNMDYNEDLALLAGLSHARLREPLKAGGGRRGLFEQSGNPRRSYIKSFEGEFCTVRDG